MTSKNQTIHKMPEKIETPSNGSHPITAKQKAKRHHKLPEVSKPVIYQMLPRLFANFNDKCVPNGDIKQNGCGKLNDITDTVLASIRDLGVTHVWYTGVIEHAHATDYSAFGITPDNPVVVKGKAGSPYAIKDYYDIDPDLAVSVPDRIKEFESLIERTHNAGMRVVMDFVPNHVARRYHSDVHPKGLRTSGVVTISPNFFLPPIISITSHVSCSSLSSPSVIITNSPQKPQATTASTPSPRVTIGMRQ